MPSVAAIAVAAVAHRLHFASPQNAHNTEINDIAFAAAGVVTVRLCVADHPRACAGAQWN